MIWANEKVPNPDLSSTENIDGKETKGIIN